MRKLRLLITIPVEAPADASDEEVVRAVPYILAHALRLHGENHEWIRFLTGKCTVRVYATEEVR